MLELIAVLANLATIAQVILGLRPKEGRRKWVIGAMVSASVGLAVLLYGVIVENRPAATIVTSLTSYKDGNYSGRQEQFYSFPFLMFDRGVLRLEYSTRNDRGSGPPSTYSGYAVTSTDQFAALSPQSKLEVSFPKYRQLQCVCVATLENTMDVPKNDDAWYEPKG